MTLEAYPGFTPPWARHLPPQLPSPRKHPGWRFETVKMYLLDFVRRNKLGGGRCHRLLLGREGRIYHVSHLCRALYNPPSSPWPLYASHPRLCSNFTATKAQFNNYLLTKRASFEMSFFGYGAHAISCRATIRKSSIKDSQPAAIEITVAYIRRDRADTETQTQLAKSCGLHWPLKASKLLWLQVQYQRPRYRNSLRATLVLSKLYPPIIRRHVTRNDKRATRQITTILDYAGRSATLWYNDDGEHV